MEITYRRATSEDAEILASNRILFATELAGEQSPEIVARLRRQMTRYFTKATARKSCVSIIASCEGKIAGIGSLHVRRVPGNFKNISGKWGYIMNMYTLPEFRKRGICTAILNALVEEGKEMGITAFELHATEKGEPVYAKNHFMIHKEPTYRRYI